MVKGMVVKLAIEVVFVVGIQVEIVDCWMLVIYPCLGLAVLDTTTRQIEFEFLEMEWCLQRVFEIGFGVS